MAVIKKLGATRKIIHISPSIRNWREKILKRYKAKEYNWKTDLYQPVTFFGLYRPKDFFLFYIHRGEKTVHWQGSDILAAGWHYRWLQKQKAKHICENEVEQGVLRLMLQQEIEVRPTFLSDPHGFKISYKQSDRPHIFIHVNKNAERESGMATIERVAKRTPEVTFHVYGLVKRTPKIINVQAHGYVPEKQFNKEIKNFQAGLRLHEFDGMSEILSKSILMGQWPISRIRYPHIDTYKNEEELIKLLKNLKNKKKPNIWGRKYYLKKFCELHPL